MRTRKNLMCVAALGALLTLVMSSMQAGLHAAPVPVPGAANSSEKNDGCSAESIAGKWGYTYTGTIVGLGPVASVGSFSLDAKGALKGSQTRSFTGDVATETLWGSVTVNADCTGTATINVYLDGALERTSTLSLVFDHDQKELRAIFTSLVPGPVPSVITIDGKRI